MRGFEDQAKDFADTDASKSHSATVIGSRLYHAPEVRPHQERGRKADVFALGCVYSEMLTVCRGTSLEEYREARIGAGSSVFRDSLDAVREWVCGLGTRTQGDKLHEALMTVILEMIEKDKDRMVTSDKALNSLKWERALFCVE